MTDLPAVPQPAQPFVEGVAAEDLTNLSKPV